MRFPGVEGEWENRRLQQVTTYVDYRGKAPIKTDEGHFLVTAKNIKKGFIDYENSKEYVSEKDYSNVMSKGLPEIGDVLFTTEAPMGNVAQVDDKNIALAQRVIKFSGRSNLENSYLLYYMLSDVFQKKISEKAIGTTVQGISGKELHQIDISFPQIYEQIEIASFLSLIDNRIQCQSKIIERLETLIKEMSDKLFSNQLRFKKSDGSNFSEWEIRKMREIGTFFSGGTPLTSKKHYYTGDIPFIKSGEISSNKTEQFISEQGFKESSAKMVKVGDIMYALYGATSGEVAISKIDGAINQAILCIRVDMNNIFLMNYLKLRKEIIIKTYLQGGQGNLSAEIVKSLEIPLPCPAEQILIADFLSSIDEKIETEKKILEQYKIQKAYLLQSMFI